jgi:hypothetical protein
MRSRFCFAMLAVVLVVLTAQRAAAQDQSSAASGGLSGGNYLRLSGGVVKPVNAEGSLRDWDNGQSFAVNWENWSPGPGGGSSRVAFGFGAVYNRLPLNESQFLANFTPPTGGTATSATASSATILEINSGIRLRIPAPYVVPAFKFGFGFINWAPGTVNYVSSNGSTGTAKQQHRSGAEVVLGGSLDAPLFDRYALFGEAEWVYGFTSFGRGFTTPGGACASNGCDPLKNTSIGTIRGGLRIRVGR